jgi:phage terminase large subunit-like protein
VSFAKQLADSVDKAPLSPEQLRALRNNKDKARLAARLAEAGQKGLIAFATCLWAILDPGVAFVDGWAIRAIAEHLEAVTSGQIKKLLINVPPGFSKSLLVNVYWPAWEWGPKERPHERYICTSFDQTLVIRDNIKCRNLLLSDEYQMVYGDVFTLSQDQNTKVRFSNSKTGWKAAKAIGGLTGDRGSRFIFDDPQSVLGAASDAETDTILESFSHAMPTRVQTKDDPFIGIMQRLRENDVSGFILANELGFEHLVIPMHYTDNHPFKSSTSLKFVDPRSIENHPARGYYVVTRDPDGTEHREWRSCWHDGMVAQGYLASPDRFPPEQVTDLEKTMASRGGTAAIAGQLEQRPYAEGGDLFDPSWWKTWYGPLPAGCQFVRGWDFASSEKKGADWTVGVLLARLPARAGYVVMDIQRFKAKPGGVRKRVIATAKADRARFGSVRISFPKDPGAGGEWVIADLRQDLPDFDVHDSREDKSKLERARPVAAAAETMPYFIHEDMHKKPAEGVAQKAEGDAKIVSQAKVFIDIHTAFPFGAHDDDVDGHSRAYGVLAEMPEPTYDSEVPISFGATTTIAQASSLYEGDGW